MNDSIIVLFIKNMYGIKNEIIGMIFFIWFDLFVMLSSILNINNKIIDEETIRLSGHNIMLAFSIDSRKSKRLICFNTVYNG